MRGMDRWRVREAAECIRQTVMKQDIWYWPVDHCWIHAFLMLLTHWAIWLFLEPVRRLVNENVYLCVVRKGCLCVCAVVMHICDCEYVVCPCERESNYRWDENSVNTATVTMEENKKTPLRSNLCMQTGRNACDLTPLSFKFPIYVLKVRVCVWKCVNPQTCHLVSDYETGGISHSCPEMDRLSQQRRNLGQEILFQSSIQIQNPCISFSLSLWMKSLDVLTAGCPTRKWSGEKLQQEILKLKRRISDQPVHTETDCITAVDM